MAGMKKQEMIASRVPADIIVDLKRLEEVEHIYRSTAIRKLIYTGLREWKLEYAAKLYWDNKVTLARAAEEAGVSVREIMDYFRQQKVPMQYDLDDLERDLKGIYARLASRDVHE